MEHLDGVLIDVVRSKSTDRGAFHEVLGTARPFGMSDPPRASDRLLLRSTSEMGWVPLPIAPGIKDVVVTADRFAATTPVPYAS